MENRGRLLWPDVAKGVCIVLVVLWHVTRKDYLALPWSVSLPVTGAWGTLSESLLPVRMPLFFFVSGLFATTLVDRPWRAVLTRRVLPLLYLFVLWTLLHTLVLRLAPGFDTAVASSPAELLAGLTITPGNLWYLLALPAYVVVARATRRAPAVALGAALVLSVVAFSGWVPTPGNRAGLLANLVFFLLGTRCSPQRVGRGPAWVGGAAVLALVAGVVSWQVLDADRWPGVRPGLGLLGILAGIAAAGLLARSRVGPVLGRLGQQTLPVYVLHLPLVALLHRGAASVVGEGGGAASSVLLATAYPAMVTAVVVGACVLLHRALLGARAGWLFAAPWTVAAPVSAAPRPPTRVR